MRVHIETLVQRVVIARALAWAGTGYCEDSAAIFRDNCLRCHTIDKVASTAVEGTEAEQRDSPYKEQFNHRDTEAQRNFRDKTIHDWTGAAPTMLTQRVTGVNVINIGFLSPCLRVSVSLCLCVSVVKSSFLVHSSCYFARIPSGQWNSARNP